MTRIIASIIIAWALITASGKIAKELQPLDYAIRDLALSVELLPNDKLESIKLIMEKERMIKEYCPNGGQWHVEDNANMYLRCFEE